MNKIILSLILCSRNDSYMGNSRWRLETSINLALLNAKAAGVLDKIEVIVSDWGSEEPLSEVLSLIPEAKGVVYFVYIPKNIAEVEQKDSKFPEVIALNAAARRASGDFIGRIDNDTIVGEGFYSRFFNLINKKVGFPYDLNSSFLFVERRSVPYRFTSHSVSLKLVQIYLVLFGQKLKIETGREFHHPFWQSPVGIMLFHRNLWFQSGGYDQKLIYWGWMEGDFALRLEQKHKLVDFKDFVGNHLYHLEHYHNLTDYNDRNGPATPRQKNKVVVDGLSYQANDKNWGLGNEEKITKESYNENKVNKYQCPLEINLSELIKFPFWMISLNTLLFYDEIKLEGFSTLLKPIRNLKNILSQIKKILD